MKVSMILPTIGRKKELKNFLSSVSDSFRRISGCHSIQIVVVDQNDANFGIKDIVNEYSEVLNIEYVHSDKKGLSLCRNIGLLKADGEIICFPDDDCEYYEDTLENMVNYFDSNSHIDIAIGRIYSRKENQPLFKKWPEEQTRISLFNFYFYSSSITIFVRSNSCRMFDEKMGAGALYGSCEDPDFLYRLLNKSIVYTPKIEVWHPRPDFKLISLSKVESYASGFGYFVSKDPLSIKSVLLIMMVCNKTLQLLFFRSRFRGGYFTSFFAGLIKGIKNEPEVK